MIANLFLFLRNSYSFILPWNMFRWSREYVIIFYNSTIIKILKHAINLFISIKKGLFLIFSLFVFLFVVCIVVHAERFFIFDGSKASKAVAASVISLLCAAISSVILCSVHFEGRKIVGDWSYRMFAIYVSGQFLAFSCFYPFDNYIKTKNSILTLFNCILKFTTRINKNNDEYLNTLMILHSYV